MELTATQAKVLKFVASYIKDNGYPPTRREVSDHFKWAYPSSAEDHLRAIERKGYLTITPNISRGIVIK